MNAYEMQKEVRDNIGESTAAHWSDLAILRKLNAGQRKAYHLISQTVGDWFLKRETITPASGVVTLPADCGKPVYMEQVSTGLEIPINITVRERRASRIIGVDFDGGADDAYLLEGSIEINNENFSGNVYLWYERRIPDLHFGTAGAGGAASLTLADAYQHSLQDDYYNNMTIEIVSGTGSAARDTITDYTASTRACVVTGTYSTSSIYGLVSVLPREACDLMIIHATMGLMAKPSSNADQAYFSFWNAQLREAQNTLEDWCSQRLKNSLRTRLMGDYA